MLSVRLKVYHYFREVFQTVMRKSFALLKTSLDANID